MSLLCNLLSYRPPESESRRPAAYRVSGVGSGAENGAEQARKSFERERGFKNTVERERDGSGRSRSGERGLRKEE